MKRLSFAAAAALASLQLLAWDPPAKGPKANPAAGEGRRSWAEVKAVVEKTMLLEGKCDLKPDGQIDFNDMGVLDLGGTLTAEEERTQVILWHALTSPVRWVVDPAKMRPEIRAMLLDNRDLDNVGRDFVARQAYPVARQNGAVALLKDCWGLNGTSKVVTFYNPTDAAVDFTLTFRDAEVDGEVTVNDVLDKAPSCKLTGSMKVTVPPHGAKLYRLFAKKAVMRSLYPIGAAKLGQFGADVQFRHVYAPKDGAYTLSVEADKDAVYTVQVNGLVVKKDCRGPVTVPVKLFKAENFVRLFSDTAKVPVLTAIRVTQNP